MFDAVYRPGVALGNYPEKPDGTQSRIEQGLNNALRRLRSTRTPRLTEGLRFVEAVSELSEQFNGLSDEDFKARCFDIRIALQQRGYTDDLITHAFAAVREASGRILGKRHFTSQVLGGWALFKGRVAEMQTGEGKTITTLLPACTAAMAGVPVHVITANDYLAARDAESLAAVYEWFGLSVGVLDDDVVEPAARKAVYDSNIVYCSPSQLAFDYLRDRMAMGERRDRIDHQVRAITGDAEAGAPLLMRGLCFAIVDEADSVLIDDACTPLILSQQSGEPPAPDPFQWALSRARELVGDDTIRVNLKYREIRLTGSGGKQLREAIANHPPPTEMTAAEAENLVQQALQALHCYRIDHDYLVRDGRIELIDSNTGRAKPDHAWERGLHQMVEAKENCELTAPRTTMARMSYQRFFRRYLHLCGMSGTVQEVATELWTVYGLEVTPIPPNKKNRRQGYGETIYPGAEERNVAIADYVKCLQRAQRATLIGTRSVADSEAMSAALANAGIEHTVLNARQDKAEAELVAKAGEPGAVMVATNMAGRGTDIELAPRVLDGGGLHVIIAGRNNSRRVDRQLIGRAARQGDPGSWQCAGSLEDALLKDQLPESLTVPIRWLFAVGLKRAGRIATGYAQRRAEKQEKAQRTSVLRFDEQSKERFGFAGPME